VSKDQVIGTLLLMGCLLGIVVYGGLIFLTGWSLLVIQLTAFIAVAGVLGIVAWIGYTLATTPPPKPIEDISADIGAVTVPEPAVGVTQKQADSSSTDR